MKPVIVIGVIIAVLLIVIALKSGQKIKKVHGPGGIGVEFSEEKSPQDNSLSFSIYYEINPKYEDSGVAEIFLGGEKVGTLAVNASQTHQSLSIKVPRPGSYHYRIKLKETRYVDLESDPDTTDREIIRATDNGKIDVQPGVAFNVKVKHWFGDKVGHEVGLEKVLSEEEARKKEIEGNINRREMVKDIAEEYRKKNKPE